MRLVRLAENGHFAQKEFTGKAIPRYAILSHTWGEDDQEISFEDIRTGTGENKAGYIKLQFCAKQAASDGLEFFWIDTCCIDKASSTELSEAINSMFRWYRDAARCYAYLADVATDPDNGSATNLGQSWRTVFRESKWFTRGWTLQELLAPASVEFFDANGTRLGDKHSLFEDISKTTGIPFQAMDGSVSLSLFSIDERLSWAAERETKREEDAAYSLLGLLDLSMPLVYGEGRKKAFNRLHRELQITRAYEGPNSVIMDPSLRHSHREVSDTPASSDFVRPNRLKRTASKAFELSPFDTRGPKGADMRALNSGSRVYHRESSAELVDTSQSDEEDTVERKAELMQTWWDETIAGHMDPPDQYHKVAVMLIKWADELDELGARKEVDDLELLLRERFRFNTEIVELDVSTKPQHQLDRHTTAFIEGNDGPHNLLIVFYQGHSIYNELYDRLELSASVNPHRSLGMHKYALVNWRRTEDMLRSDDVDGDVLTILDASWASNMAENGKANLQIKSTKKLFELMSACPVDQMTDPPGPKSFTRALIDTLTEMARTFGSRPFATPQVNQRVRMVPSRKGTPSQLYSLLANERHIALSPVRAKEGQEKRAPWPQNPARSYLKLGLAFRDEFLNKQQIEFLTLNLTRALKDARFIGLRKIDWLGIEIRPTVQLEQTAWAKTAFSRWKEAVRKSKTRRHLRTAAADPIEEYHTFK